MVRSAAKNYEHVAVVTDPADYEAILRGAGAARAAAIGADTRFRLAQKAFSHTAAYDGAISNYLTALDASGERAAFPRRLNLQFELAQTLRYGENPHQAAAFYRDPAAGAGQPRALPPAAGQGAFLQQHRRRRCGVGMREELCPAGVRHRQARQSLRRGGGGRRRRRPTGRRTPPIPPPPSAASSPSTASSTRRPPGASSQQFVEVVIAPRHRRRGGRGCWRARPISAC